MITNLFKLAADKEPAEGNNKNDAQKALKPQMQTEQPVPFDEGIDSSGKRMCSPPGNLDQLARAAHELLMDKNLEVGKVRPFFWSMVETYVDRFQVYPFDVVKALFSYLESRDYPAEQIRELVDKLEQCYLQNHGQAMRKSTQLACEQDSLDDELKELRESIKYAALVGELEDER